MASSSPVCGKHESVASRAGAVCRGGRKDIDIARGVAWCIMRAPLQDWMGAWVGDQECKNDLIWHRNYIYSRPQLYRALRMRSCSTLPRNRVPRTNTNSRLFGILVNNLAHYRNKSEA
jgi:hypothetical protein